MAAKQGFAREKLSTQMFPFGRKYSYECKHKVVFEFCEKKSYGM